MTVGPFLWRELGAAARRGDRYAGRVASVALLTLALAACVGTWDYAARDRSSVEGNQIFGFALFGVCLGILLASVIGVVPGIVAAAIAGERDRKTIDALLGTRLCSAEIVLGTMAAGLLRVLVQLAPVFPVVVMVVVGSGLDVRWAALALALLASTSVALGALSIAVSAGARTARRATGLVMSVVAAWFFAPVAAVGLVARGWPAGARWALPAVLWILDSSPLVIVMNYLGLVRRATLAGAVLRMVALQSAAAVALVVWATLRLRPASRAVHDGEGRAALLRTLRIRRRRRPACWDDPVLWNEVCTPRAGSELERLLTSAVQALLVVALTVATSWFALPAFAELLDRGYSWSPEGLRMPEFHPIVRLILQKLTPHGSGPAAGQARLEFNIVLRQVSVVFSFISLLAVAGSAAEAFVSERERDTWLGLIATPLTGAEILRAKMLGAVWRARECVVWMLPVWAVGLLTGALHPVGFLAGVVQLAAATWMAAAMGVDASLRAKSRDVAVSRVVLPVLALALSGMALLFFPRGGGTVLLGAGSPPFLAWASLVSYEDMHSALGAGEFPQLAASTIHTGEGARRIAAAWLVGTAGYLGVAYGFTRRAIRDFDAVAGRPRQRRPGAIGQA